MITLYKGDDTNGKLGKKCVVRFHCDDVIDMEGVTVKFNLLNIVTKEFNDVHDGDELEVFVSHIDSRKLPLGIVYGRLWGEDSSGKIRTFANRIPFVVTTDLRKVYGSDGLDSVDVHVYASVDWDSIASKPTLFPSRVDMVEGLGDILSSPESIKKIEDYLYEVNYGFIDKSIAETHFKKKFAGDGASDFGFGCSFVRSENLVGHTYDWKKNDAASFVVRTPANGERFASIAVCSSPDGVTNRGVEEKTISPSLWAVIPFYAVDGINENGVSCSVCVVRASGHESELWSGRNFCAVGGVRQVLDKARTAEDGAHMIREGAWMPAYDKMGGYSLHFIVSDSTHTFLVEDGIVFDMTEDERKVVTNFRIGGLEDIFDEQGNADASKIANYDPYGTGVERYNILADYLRNPSGTLWSTVRKCYFTEAYQIDSETETTTRPSEFAGIDIGGGHIARIDDSEAIGNWFVDHDIHGQWQRSGRDGKFWQTVHASVYNLEDLTLSISAQESVGSPYSFAITKAEGGEGTVKSVNDIPPNARTGNVALMAQDIPYGGEGASNVETAIEQNTQAIDDNAEAIDSIEQQLGELKDDTYTKSEVDDKINQSSAHYLTKRAGTEGHYTYPQFATHADLAAAKAAHTEANPQFFYGDEAHTPDKNDYCIVLADETHGGATTRYMFVGSWNDNGYFRYQYTINQTAFTDEQWAAINSLTSVDEDGNLCFDGIPFINSSGELLFTEDDPIFTAWKNEVQIVLGGGANIASGKYKQIAIGAHATANGQNAIALGSSEPGGKTNGPRAMAQNAVAIGAGANATATNAVQIFAGTNNKSGTIQLGNKTVAFLSDIPITTTDIDDYRYYKGHWSMGVIYKTGDIVRAERTVEGQEEKEVVYFKSLRDNNLAQNPFNEGSTYWTRTTDDEGLDKLSLFVKAAIAGMTGADIPVSPTNSDKIDIALGKVETVYLKYDGTNIKCGDTILTSFSALLNLVRTGRVILEANATPSLASSLALFRPQLNNANAILFDATGEINGVIETRNINVKRKGTDGIEVVSGGLIALAKKTDIPAVVTPSPSAISGNAADAKMIWDRLGAFFGDVPVVGFDDFFGYKMLWFYYDAVGKAGIYYDKDVGKIKILSDAYGSPVTVPNGVDEDSTLALTSEVTAATKLTPVYSEWTAADTKYQEIIELIVWRDRDDVKESEPENNWGWGTWHEDGFGRLDEPNGKDKNTLSLSFLGEEVATRTLDHYLTARGEKILAGDTAALFAIPTFAEAVEKVFENGDEIEFGGAE